MFSTWQRTFQKRREILGYGVLLLMITPNLIWILLDRSAWISDTSFYALSATRLHHMLIHDIGNWWGEMLAISTTKPPMLPWIGQFFVPIGMLIGNIDSGLLLVTFAAQFVGLVLLQSTLKQYFKKTSYALVGCLLVATAPIFVDTSRQFYAQPLQFVAVCWFLYIMAHSKRWDTVFVILHLVAASAFAMATMMSSLVFCVIPGIVSLNHAWTNREGALQWGREHAGMTAMAAALTLPTISWYLGNFDTAMEYAQLGYNYTYGASVRDIFLLKFAQWGKLTLSGFRFSAFVALIGAGALLGYAAKRKTSAKDHAGMLGLMAMQVILVMGMFAGSAQQTYRYVMPLAPYLAVIGMGGLVKTNKRWLTLAVLLTLVSQLTSVNLHTWRGQQTKLERQRYLNVVSAITEATAENPTDVVLLATNQLDVYGHDAAYHASKQPGYFPGRHPPYQSIEFMLLNLHGDVDAVWNQILTSRPGYIVTKSNRVRRERRAPDGSWMALVDGIMEISDRVEGSQQFARVTTFGSSEIEIYRRVR